MLLAVSCSDKQPALYWNCWHYACKLLSKLGKLTSNADVLQARHELTVEAAHGVTREEAVAPLAQMGVDVAELVEQRLLGLLIPAGQHQLEFLCKASISVFLILPDHRDIILLTYTLE